MDHRGEPVLRRAPARDERVHPGRLGPGEPGAADDARRAAFKAKAAAAAATVGEKAPVATDELPVEEDEDDDDEDWRFAANVNLGDYN
mgnify:CR=1 FL=1